MGRILTIEYMIVRSIAPLRVSFSGGGTDITEYFSLYGGAVISGTINWYAHTHLHPIGNSFRVISIDFGTDERIEHFGYDGKNDLVKATLRKMGFDKANEGAEFLLHTDVPPGTGLGASSAIVVSLIGAIANWRGNVFDNYEIAELSYDVERNELGIKGGWQDQFSATFGGFNYIEFHKEGKVIVNPLRIAKDTVKELESHLLLCYTGVKRLSANIISRQIEDLNRGRNTEFLHDQKRMALEMKNALLKGNLDDFGIMLDEAWQSKRKITTGISNPAIDKLYDTARMKGAMGGKILGAGGGGYLLLYCDYRKRHDVMLQLQSVGVEPKPFSFVGDGLYVWRTRNTK